MTLSLTMLASVTSVIFGIQAVSGNVIGSNVPQTTPRCPEPFVNLAGKCYWFYGEETSLDFDTASSKCTSEGADLAQIFDQGTQNELTQWISRNEDRMMSYWIGLADTDRDGEFGWKNGEDSAYRAWAQEQPSSGRHCTVMSRDHSQKWKAVDCSETHLFVCQKNILPGPRGRILLRNEDDLEQFCSHRTLGYYPHPTDCRKYILCFGGSLYSYSCHGKEIFNELNTMCEKRGPGVVCSAEGAPETEPPTPTPKPGCGEYSYDNDYETEYGDSYAGYDEEYECGDESEEWTEAPPITTTTKAVVPTTTIGDYPDYICEGTKYHKLGKTCYKVFPTPTRWTIANEMCVGEEGGRLVIIKSKQVQRFLVSKLPRKSAIFDLWIGLNDQKTPETFVWSDDSVLLDQDYENWSKKSRKRHRELKQCVAISRLKRGSWNDQICLNQNGYICERDAANPSDGARSAGPKARALGGLPPGWKHSNSFCGSNRVPGEPAAVVGGQTSNANEHPWQVSLRSLGSHRCGGSLIDSCWVLTAAHCVDRRATGFSKLPKLAVVGDFDTSVPEGTEQYLPISSIILHPHWTARPVPTNDIALVKLGKCVESLNTICLPALGYDTFDTGDMCKATGWGTINPASDDQPAQLQEANLPIMGQEICEEKYVEHGVSLVTDTMFCAGYLEGGVDTCNGDSGGPLACKHPLGSRVIQWGIISWGFGCAQKDRPGVYTRLTSYMEWIRNNTMILF